MTKQEPTSPGRRRGRPPGSGSTRNAVLEVARRRFATEGFTETTIRSIASDAAVDPSQVMQFFGSKEALFAAVMSIPPTVIALFDTAFEGPDERLGERVVRAYLQAWEGSAEESEPLMAMLRGAIVNNAASTQLADFIQSRLVCGTKDRIGDDAESALRAGLASAMLVGLVTSRRIIGVPLLAEADAETLIRVVGPAIQKILAQGQTTGTPHADPGRAASLIRTVPDTNDAAAI
ncbi:TetR/AcrR family transcriptional regulator [Arthrobacter livingstonensis]|uniref:TetR/AcrR family transcriptional regulator n=1 Tax=Arthrobacter livingstonensis TaxID=670078 RepID=A0A2V5L3T2_9MICC|nr:TetR family transcriptional regulator [Arthrobacter livingstonensis]PYI65959.1 TetR/AcrR family transcriptional regulator [Arthrobacter livingstonensis]